MAQDFSTTALLASLKRRGMLPSTAETLSTADFLAFATEELQTYITGLLLSVREEYAVADYDITIVAGTDTYALPPRATGEKLRNVLMLVGSGYVPLLRIEPERINSYGDTGQIAGYTVKGDDLVFVPSSSGASTIRCQYFRRPSSLVATSAVCTATVVSSTVVTATVPATFTTSTACDFVKATPPFKVLAMDKIPTVVTSTTSLTFAASTIPSGFAVGDYVCLAGESAVPQIPVELHPLLAQRTVVKCLEALGSPNLAASKVVCDEMKVAALTLLTPRVEGASRPIVNYFGPGFRRFRR